MSRDCGSRRGQVQNERRPGFFPRATLGRLDGQAGGQGCNWKVSDPGHIGMGVVVSEAKGKEQAGTWIFHSVDKHLLSHTRGSSDVQDTFC